MLDLFVHVLRQSILITGLVLIMMLMIEYFNLVKGNGYYKKKRREQAQFWMYESINESLKNNFYENPVIEEELKKIPKDKVRTIAESNICDIKNSNRRDFRF
jgi:putative protein kinase ArgK-like GTPase of G3E family